MASRTKAVILVTAIIIILSGNTDSARVAKREGGRVDLRCRKKGTTITVITAYYGSLPKNKPTACGDPNAKVTIAGICDGRVECSAIVSDSLFLGTTCGPSVRKQTLIVTYNCEKEVDTPTVRQGKTKTISCSGGGFILISSAIYGFGSGPSCSDPNALTIMEGLCNNLPTCTVTADDATFPSSTCNARRRESLKIIYECVTPRGPIYPLWGGITCPSSSALVYAGFMAGSSFDGTGNGANYQCLPTSPVYDAFNTSANANRAGISVATLATDGSVLASNLNEKIIQCSMCQTITANTVTMLIGNNTCPSSWTTEYTGYLVSEQETSGRTGKGYACLKENPDLIDNSSGKTNTATVNLVEHECGALPCGTYTNYQEVACIVCSI